METTIKKISELDNPLFSRKEFHFKITAKSVPSHEEVKNLLKEKFSFNSELLRIKKIKGKFGSQIFDIHVNLYSTKEEFKRIVKKTKQELEKEKKAVEEESKANAEAKKAAAEAKNVKEEDKRATEEVKVKEVEKPIEAPAEESKSKENKTEESKVEVSQ